MEKARSKKESRKRKIDPKLFAILAAITCLVLYGLFRVIIIRSAACTYVMTDGERYETVRLYPGSVEEACSKAGFRNVEVVNRKDDDGIVYLTLKETFDVSIQTSDETLTIRTAPCTVGELLEANGISVGSDDIVTPDVDDWLSESSQITVTRVSFSTVTETEDVPFSVEVQYDSQLLKGVQEIARYGENGEKSIEYRVEEHDGEEVAREVVKEEEVKPPVNCIVKQGIRIAQNKQEEQATASESTTATSSQTLPSSQPETESSGELSTAGRSQVWSVPAGIDDDTENKIITAGDGSSYEYTAVIDVTATAYHRVEDGGEITASGTVTQYGTIAVDPRVIPLGSRLYVVSDGGDQSWSYGPGLAEDTGGLIKGTKIDLFFMTGDEADDFGIRPAKVYILKD
nr:3D domain-containing protein [uncultured Agathobaculum sp.]